MAEPPTSDAASARRIDSEEALRARRFRAVSAQAPSSPAPAHRTLSGLLLRSLAMGLLLLCAGGSGLLLADHLGWLDLDLFMQPAPPMISHARPPPSAGRAAAPRAPAGTPAAAPPPIPAPPG